MDGVFWAVFLPTVIGLGVLTAAVAKRYRRDPLAWGVFGAALFVIAMPVLLYLGRDDPRGSGGRTRRSSQRSHLPSASATEQQPEGAPEAAVVAESGRTGDEPDARLRRLRQLLDQGLISEEEFAEKRRDILNAL